MSEIVREVAGRLGVRQVLDACGLPFSTRDRMPCPIHGGSDKSTSFAIRDDKWAKCFSHGCLGEKGVDALDLYCTLRHQGRFRELDKQTKPIALREAGQIAGVEVPETKPRTPEEKRAFAQEQARREALRQQYGNWSREAWQAVAEAQAMPRPVARAILGGMPEKVELSQLVEALPRSVADYLRHLAQMHLDGHATMPEVISPAWQYWQEWQQILRKGCGKA